MAKEKMRLILLFQKSSFAAAFSAVFTVLINGFETIEPSPFTQIFIKISFSPSLRIFFGMV